MTAFTYIGIGIFCLGWIVLLILSLAYQFKDDQQDKQPVSPLSKARPYSTSETGTPG